MIFFNLPISYIFLISLYFSSVFTSIKNPATKNILRPNLKVIRHGHTKIQCYKFLRSCDTFGRSIRRTIKNKNVAQVNGQSNSINLLILLSRSIFWSWSMNEHESHVHRSRSYKWIVKTKTHVQNSIFIAWINHVRLNETYGHLRGSPYTGDYSFIIIV